MRRLSIGLTLAALASCTTTITQPTKAAPAGECDAGKASAFLGQKATDVAEQARIAAGAKSLRVIAPDQAVTMDFRADRLNLDTDAAGTILKARCG